MSKFNNLIVFEMANNHQGSLQHGLLIIREMGAIARKYNLHAALKLQYRQLDTFIHPVKRLDLSIPYVKRFLSTALSVEDYGILVKEIKKQGMMAMVTPFDEESVDVIMSQDVDIIKVASCSGDDWPLLEKIAKTGKPILASTGGLSINEIDNLVSFFTHKVEDFGLMHCVSIYPTPNNQLDIGFLGKLIRRYPGIPIGWSGHEPPGNTVVAQAAISIGAKILERHVGVQTETITLNSYSMNPDEVESWVKAIQEVKVILGDGNKYTSETETKSLLDLKRGVFAKETIKAGEEIQPGNCYFAFPCEEGQLTSGEFGKLRASFKATRDYSENEAIFEQHEEDQYHIIRTIIHDARGMLAEANVILNENAQIELSHHFGLEHFKEYGCLLISIVNREYCKKIIIVFPGQSHPEQYHVKKEETFHVLWGDLQLTLNGITQELKKGELRSIERGVRHSFTSKEGAIFEEVSTTHYRGDSFYLDPRIDQQDPMARKTVIEHF
ncbi:MAG: N-acetylneuraminate synthase family protein [Saprospiraceae bacterium]